MLLANARMSPISFRNWRRFPASAKTILKAFDRILAQDQQQCDHFEVFARGRVQIAGNLKYDVPPLADVPAMRTRLAAPLANRPLWLASSTHPGEEQYVLAAHQALKKTFPTLCTLIAPRHPHRGADIAALCQDAGLSYVQRSKQEWPTPTTDIAIIDTLGELGALYRLCSIIFVGGSLVPHGGHNLLEPALLDSAILHGPHTFNFAAITADLQQSHATRMVQDAEDLADAVHMLLQDDDEQKVYAVRARTAATQQQGALQKTMDALHVLIEATTP